MVELKKVERMSPQTGRRIKEDDSVVNIADILDDINDDGIALDAATLAVLATLATTAKQDVAKGVLDSILAKIIEAPSSEAKQDALNTLIGALASAAVTDPAQAASVIAALKGILTDLGQTSDALVAAGAVGSLSAKIRRLTTDIGALLALIGEVQASPTENTVLERLKAIEDKLISGIPLSGSNVDLRGLSTGKPSANSVDGGVTYWSVDKGVIEVSDGTSWILKEIVINGTMDYLTPYGYKIDESNINCETAVTYIYGSVGKTPAVVSTGASASWDATPIYSNIRPCMFKNGAVNYYLSETNITKKSDGVTDADITSGADGDVMIEFPTLYWKMGKIDNEIYAYLSPVNIDTDTKPLAHTVGATVKNKIYIGVYPGIIIDNKLRSLSGATPTHTQTISTFRTAAQANGAGYQQFGYYQWLMLQHLFYLRFKNRDSQTALGKGYTNLDAIKATGDTNAQTGLYYGTTSDQVSMKCFGLEALWDYQVNWTDGIFADANRNILIGNQTAYNDTGAEYTNYGQAAVTDINGYIGTVQGGTETGFIVKTVDGSYSTKFADAGYLNASSLAYSGGNRANGATAGIGRFVANNSGAYAHATIGGRLVFVGSDNGIA